MCRKHLSARVAQPLHVGELLAKDHEQLAQISPKRAALDKTASSMASGRNA
jgi:hypothetical protein